MPPWNLSTVRIVYHGGESGTARVLEVQPTGAWLQVWQDVGHSMLWVNTDGKIPGSLFHVIEDDLPLICDHEWTGHRTPGTVHGPEEYHELCKKCGMENSGSFVE